MPRETVHTDAAPAAVGPYVQAVRHGGLLYCSGQIALDPASGALTGDGDVAKEAEQALVNLGAVLEAGGSGWDRVLKTTIYLADMADVAVVNEVYGARFEGMDPPARATVAVAGLPKGARVEVECVAEVG